MSGKLFTISRFLLVFLFVSITVSTLGQFCNLIFSRFFITILFLSSDQGNSNFKFFFFQFFINVSVFNLIFSLSYIARGSSSSSSTVKFKSTGWEGLFTRVNFILIIIHNTFLVYKSVTVWCRFFSRSTIREIMYWDVFIYCKDIRIQVINQKLWDRKKYSSEDMFSRAATRRLVKSHKS